MRAHDVITLRSRQVVADRVHIKAQKTGKMIDMKLAKHSEEIIKTYKGGAYVFPLMPTTKMSEEKYLKVVNAKNSLINKYLVKVTDAAYVSKKITMHTARHTFAYLADLKGVSVGTIQSLLDHSKLETTERYIRTLKKSDELDSAVESMWE